MIAKTLVFVCAAIGVATASCFDFRATQSCGSQIVAAQPVVADNTFSSCGSCGTSFAAPTCGASLVSAPVLANVDNVFGNNFVSAGNAVSVAQASNGPETPAYPVVQAPSVTLPTVEGPIVTISSPPIPAPRVIAQKCICTKTVVKPQVIQRCITVPKVQRYLKRTVTPVVENVAYKSKPINTCGSSVQQSPVVLSSGSVSGGYGSCNFQSGIVAPVAVSSGSCGSPCSRVF